MLSTCNRTEVYAFGQKGDPGDLRNILAQHKTIDPGDLQHTDRRFVSSEVVDHLYQVVSSLDSMVIGEPEIVHQVKGAFETAREEGAIGKILGGLTQRAFQVAKRVRTETDLSSKPTSVGAVGASLAIKIFGQQGAQEILVLGAGEMAEVSLRNLMGQVEGCNVHVCNRDQEKAKRLAHEVGGEAWGLDDLATVWSKADIAICSLGIQQALITREFLEPLVAKRKGRPLFIIDLGVPRNVDGDVRHLEDVFLYNMDHLQHYADDNMKFRQELVKECLPIIAEGVKDFESWMSSLESQGVIRDVMKHHREIIDLELEKSLKKLGELDEKQEGEIRYLVERVLKKAMHHPIHTLRNNPGEEGMNWRDFFLGRRG